MKSWRAWLLVAVIFLAGAAAGGFGMRLYMARHLPELLSHTRQRLEEFFLDNIDREVGGLTEPQRKAILPILRDAVAKGEIIRESVHGQMDKVMDAADARVAAELTPEQRVKFLEFRARMEQLRREGGGPDGPGGPMPPPPPGFPPGPPPHTPA
ncbi:MAG: hypothetical protein AUJ49_13740, partial [Desulfovibrionaceae bacterium CG1_02_65_16]